MTEFFLIVAALFPFGCVLWSSLFARVTAPVPIATPRPPCRTGQGRDTQLILAHKDMK